MASVEYPWDDRREAGTWGGSETEVLMTNDERTDPKRPLFWWHVPERPGVGDAMIRLTVVWFLAVLLVAIVVGAVVALT